MHNTTTVNTKAMLLAGFLASSIVVSAAGTAAGQETKNPAQMRLADSSPPPPKIPPGPTPQVSWHEREGVLYKRNWGVDIIGVHLVSSGSMLEFRYRVLDAKKAKELNDKRWNPYLIDEATGVKLAVPQMEKIGRLRQTATPQVGRIYWMMFGNPGRRIKPGSHVSVVIGDFRVDGLVVESPQSVLVLKKP
jgi:hypothetical protein